ncbi:MAG: N-6 DNA methylase [Limisphaera sp.]
MGTLRPSMGKERPGQLIDLVSTIRVGNAKARARNLLGRVYEYFVGRFASAEGKNGGKFYTPRCVVKSRVKMLKPSRRRTHDPCRGSAGLFVQSVEFIEAHATGNSTWRLAKMNLAIRGIDGRIEQGDTFHNDRFPDLRADYILPNPPFNFSDWGGELLREDKRWKFGLPPARIINIARAQPICHDLARPTGSSVVLDHRPRSAKPEGGCV